MAARTNDATYVGLINMGSTPLRAVAVEHALARAPPLPMPPSAPPTAPSRAPT